MEDTASTMWRCLPVLFSCCVLFQNTQTLSLTAVFRPDPPCFPSCLCVNFEEVMCTTSSLFTVHVEDFNRYLFNRTVTQTTPPQVHMLTDGRTLPDFLRRIPMLHDLSFADNKLRTIQNGALTGMRLQSLNLSQNELETIEAETFLDLNRLEVLDLSYNRLSTISKQVFSNLTSLRVLALDFNRLLYFPFDAFSALPKLQVLSLNHNLLAYLTPGSLSGMSSLQSLALRNNSLRSLTVDVTEEVPGLEMLDVSANPFHCSCSIAGLGSVLSDSAVRLLHAHDMLCYTPLGLRGRRVARVMSGLDRCQKPSSVLSHDSTSVLYTDDVQLSCDIQGDPDPAIVWTTPWGHQFADLKDLPRLESVCSSCEEKRRYSSMAVVFVSSVFVTQGGKGLRITNFRGRFAGNFSCQAFNYLGNDSAVRTVGIISGVPSTFVDSLFAGAFCSGGFLCFGLFLGSINLLLQACRARFGRKRKVIRTPTIMLSHKDTSLIGHDSTNCRDFSVFSSEDLDTPPPSSPQCVSPLTSPPQLVTPNEGQGTPMGTWRAANILETMEEVSYRLRHGVGRKMKTVKRNVQSMKETGRKNVQSIRESGSFYMQNIRETGSTAASRVKAGVVMGMVTVKSHVQSIKEFCGTGVMGTHTVSAISFETNLDTNETTEVVKSVTMV